MNRQINPNHCYDTEEGMYELKSAFQVDGTRDSPEWKVTKDGRDHRTFTSLMAAKGWLEYVLEHGEQTRLKPIIVAGAEFKAKLAAVLNGGRK